MYAILVVALLMLVGCGGTSGRDHAETAPVKGKLTLAGKPLQEGTQVVLQNPDEGFVFSGPTDANGEFVILSQFSGNGVPVGTYQVTISPPPGPKVDSMQLALHPELGKITYEFPKKYTDIKTSGLTFEVTKQENVLTVDLQK